MNEKEIIDLASKYFKNNSSQIIKNIGDDCAVTVGSNKNQLYTSDMLIENTHFLLHKISPYDLGWKSLAVNISDIASMGGVPKYALLSLGLNNKINSEWLEHFYQGLSDCAKSFNTYIIGGDTVKSEHSIIINIALTGETEKPIFRDSIKENDLIFSTRDLGLSGAGFWCIKNNFENNYCISKHNKPMPKVEEGLFLNQNINNISMIDSSDGLYKSIETMCEKSDFGAEIFFDNIPINKELVVVCERSKISSEHFILYGGEDYELIFAISENDYYKIKNEYFYRFGYELKILGRFTKNRNIYIIKDNDKTILKDNSFSHF